MQGQALLTGQPVPQSHGPVRTGRDQPQGVVAECHAIDAPEVAPQGQGVPPRADIPDLYRPVGTGRGKQVAAGAKNHFINPVGAPVEREGFLARRCLECLHVGLHHLPEVYGVQGLAANCYWFAGYSVSEMAGASALSLLGTVTVLSVTF